MFLTSSQPSLINFIFSLGPRTQNLHVTPRTLTNITGKQFIFLLLLLQRPVGIMICNQEDSESTSRTKEKREQNDADREQTEGFRSRRRMITHHFNSQAIFGIGLDLTLSGICTRTVLGRDRFEEPLPLPPLLWTLGGAKGITPLLQL